MSERNEPIRSAGIARIENYTDEQKRLVTKFVPIDRKTGEPSDEKPVYRGNANFEIAPQGGNPGGRISLEFTFPENTNLNRAFKTFDKVAMEAFKAEQRRVAKEYAQEKGKIQVVGAGQVPPSILRGN